MAPGSFSHATNDTAMNTGVFLGGHRHIDAMGAFVYRSFLKRMRVDVIQCATVCIILVMASLHAHSQHALTTNDLSGFIENKGQVYDQEYKPNEAVKYILPMEGMNVQLRSDGFSYDTYTTEVTLEDEGARRDSLKPVAQHIPSEITYHFRRVDVQWVGANPAPTITASGQSGAYRNFYNPVTPEEGVCDVRAFDQVTYKELFPYVDLIFKTADGGGQVKYDLILHPGAKLESIRFVVEDPNASLDGQGWKIPMGQGELQETIPLSYWKPTREAVDIDLKVVERTETGVVFGFEGIEGVVSEMLVIDPVPVVDWSTYYGGTSSENLVNICHAPTGEVYVCGLTWSTSSIATSGAYQTSMNGFGDGVISKFTSDGVQLWSTYYGGNQNDQAWECSADEDGNVYVTGVTKSDSVMSSSGGHQTSYGGGGGDGFLAKFNSSGYRLWGTYYGGSASELAGSVCVGDSGYIYLSGSSTSSGSVIATSGAFQTTNNGNFDLYVAKFDSVGTRIWATYYGGSEWDIECDMTYDKASHSLCIVGECTSTGMSTSGAFQPFKNGITDIILAKFSPGGNRLWCTYLGGPGAETGAGIACDSSGNMIIGGYTNSAIFLASAGSHQPTYGGGSRDAVIAKFSPSGAQLWSTYYGGPDPEWPVNVAVDSLGRAYLWGTGYSSTGIATTNVLQTAHAGGSIDAYLVRFTPGGVRQFGTYFGSTGQDQAGGISVNTDGIYVTGSTTSTSGISTSGSHQPVFGGSGDGYVVKFIDSCTVPDTAGPRADLGTLCLGQGQSDTLIIDSASLFSGTNWYWYAGSCNGTLIDSGRTITVAPTQTTTYYVRGEGYTQNCTVIGVCDSVTVTVELPDTIILPDTAICAGESIMIFGSSRDSAGQYWDTIAMSAGCDSVVTQTLAVHPTFQSTLSTLTYCLGDSILVFGNYEYSPGVYYDSLQTIHGCDSVYIQEVIVWPTFTTYLPVAYVCDGDSTLIFGEYRSQSGLYYDTLQTQYGCDSVFRKELVVHQEYEQQHSDAHICRGDSALIFGVYRMESGTWIDSLQTVNGCDSVWIQSLIVHEHKDTTLETVNRCIGDSAVIFGSIQSTSGTYYDTLQTAYGCDSILSQELRIHEVIFNDLGSAAICQGDETEIFGELQSEEGVYIDTNTSAAGCDSVESLQLVIMPLPSVNMQIEPEYCPGSIDGQIILTIADGTPPYDFMWSHGLLEQDLERLEAGTYSVTVTDAHDCSSYAEAEVGYGVAKCPGGEIWVPNIFSPNDDGANDVLQVEGLGIAELEFTVFDRWGHRMFESVDQTHGWDGRHKGLSVDPGVYIYFVRCTFNNGESTELKGNVALVR